MMNESENDPVVVPEGGFHVPPAQHPNTQPNTETSTNETPTQSARFQNLNLASAYITKINPAEAETMMQTSSWELIRSKISKDVPDDALIVICAGKCFKRGSEAGLHLKGKMLGFIMLSRLIRGASNVREWCQSQNIRCRNADQKILVIGTKCWFKNPIKYPRFANNGNIVPFAKARFSENMIARMNQQIENVRTQTHFQFICILILGVVGTQSCIEHFRITIRRVALFL